MNDIKYQIYKQIDKLVDKKLQLGLTKLEQEKLTSLWTKYDLNTNWETKPVQARI